MTSQVSADTGSCDSGADSADAESVDAASASGALPPWRDPALSPEERADALIPLMTLEEKAAQLVGVWVGADASGGGVAPHQQDMAPVSWDDVIRPGLGQLTRPFGTAPIDPGPGARSLAAAQEQIAAASRFGIPAQVHEECLTGFATWGATAYPAPLAWGAAFDPDLVRTMAGRIGLSMRAVGVHQGLAPVLDVTRDYRWGRTEETIGEDPYLVGAIGAAYVRGLESAGIVATLKHFAGYSASRGGRNLAPVPMGRRELADVVLPPFETALRLGGARSVMNSYSEIDGVPAAADEELLTGLLREEWGFTGTVVSDYFAVRFLQSLHGVAADAGEAAGLALRAGIDVELPTVDAFGAPLVEAVRTGAVDEALVDRALRRVLIQKAELGLLDPGWKALPEAVEAGDLSLDDEESREIALRLARQSVTLLRNEAGILPLAPGRRVALVGPVADDPMAMLGCYSFPAHVSAGTGHGLGLEIPSLREALAVAVPDLAYAPGCGVSDDDTSGIAAAVAAAEAADVCVLAVGDRAGLFGRGTSGEGCDAPDLALPGVQPELARAVLATGTPVVLVLLAGRPYALGEEVTGAGRDATGADGGDGAAGIVYAFFAGQRGGQAIAEVLTGAVNPSGRLPTSVPRHSGGLPATYLAPPLGRRNQVSSIDPTPAFPFGHGLSYTTFEWGEAELVGSAAGDQSAAGHQSAAGEPADIAAATKAAKRAVETAAADAAAEPSGAEWPVDGTATVRITIVNTGARTGTEVVQLYLHDPVAQTTRPVVRLVGFARVELEPGERAAVTFEVSADLASFTGLRGARVVEPGDVELRFGRSSGAAAGVVRLRLTGAERAVGHDRTLLSHVRVEHSRAATESSRRELMT